eukprot:gnl/MRDRNA2_/MRDRNA2_51290_c0_seq2.p1 gnl/MRDRNA2_/MRDRNA2_51290_c0~~gnl/MRDRNA2_/MRDRNA2_51290_c0_seq2.p1  ORF type:complete len:460 (+),score=64.98 gnl/MRDRNA2_/MRDRNA2_51290_c0_seq2:144-1523(+)
MSAATSRSAVEAYAPRKNVQKLWQKYGCVSKSWLDFAIDADEPEFERRVRRLALSHKPEDQRTCYNRVSGNWSKQRFQMSLFEGNIQRVQCNEVAGAKFRAKRKIKVEPKKQRIKVKFFRKLIEALHELKVPPVLINGQLLGWWRECDFLAHDMDIDLGIFHRFVRRDFIAEMGKRGLQVAVVTPEVQRFDRVLDGVFLEFVVSADAFLDPKTKKALVHADLMVLEEGPQVKLDDKAISSNKPRGFNLAGRGNDPGKESSIDVFMVWRPLFFNDGAVHKCVHIFQTLALTQFYNVSVWVPWPPEYDLDNTYGRNLWQEPQQVVSKNYWYAGNCKEESRGNVAVRRPWQKVWKFTDEEIFLNVSAEARKRSQRDRKRESLQRSREHLLTDASKPETNEELMTNKRTSMLRDSVGDADGVIDGQSPLWDFLPNFGYSVSAAFLLKMFLGRRKKRHCLRLRR